MIAPDGAEYIGPPDPLEDFVLRLEAVEDPLAVPWWLGAPRTPTMAAAPAELAAYVRRRLDAAEALGGELYLRLSVMSAAELARWLGEEEEAMREAA